MPARYRHPGGSIGKVRRITSSPSADRRRRTPSLAKIIGPGFSEDGVVDAIEKAVTVYTSLRADGERFVDTYRRVGEAPFKEAIYG